MQHGLAWVAVRPHDRVLVVGARARGVGPYRHGGGDEPLVIEERPAEGGVEEAVGYRVPGGAGRMEVLVDRQRLRVVVADGQARLVAAEHVAVLAPAVDLILLLVELV